MKCEHCNSFRWNKEYEYYYCADDQMRMRLPRDLPAWCPRGYGKNRIRETTNNKEKHMRYIVSYRFTPKGQWYIFKSASEETLGQTVLDAFKVNGVVDVKVYKTP